MFVDYLNESKGHVKNLKRAKRLNEYYDPEDDYITDDEEILYDSLDEIAEGLENALEEQYDLAIKEFKKFDPDFVKYLVKNYNKQRFIKELSKDIWDNSGICWMFHVSEENFIYQSDAEEATEEISSIVSNYYDKYYYKKV